MSYKKNLETNKIFYARSTMCPKNWSYDHVGFILTDGRLIQMSGHKFGVGVYIQNQITDDPFFKEQKLHTIPLAKTISLDMDSTGLQNCGMYVAAQLKKNNIKLSLEKIYSVMKTPPHDK